MERTYSAGDAVFSQNEAGEECFIVLDGSVGISRLEENGDVRQLGNLGPGEFFGEMAVVDGHPRSATATALEPNTRLLAINHGQFIYLMSAQPAFALHLLEHVSARTRKRGLKPMSPTLRKPKIEGSPYTVKEVADGVTMLSSRGLACHSYLFRGPKRIVLLDSGLPSTGRELETTIEQLGIRMRDIDRLLLSHEHIDHVGGLTSFSHRPPVFAHQYAASKLETADEFGMMCSAFSERIGACNVDGLLAPGDLIETGLHSLRVHHTPGHSSGSITLHDERSGIMASGDLFLANGSLGGIFVTGSPSDSIMSLRALGKLNAKLALPGHGPVITDTAGSIEKALSNCRNLIEQSHVMFAALDHANASGRIISSFKEINRKWLAP